jgi:transposase
MSAGAIILPEAVARATRSQARQPAALPGRDGGLKGLDRLRAALPDILATRTDTLSPRLLHIIEDLIADWRRLDQRIEDVSLQIEALAKADAGCERLMTVPGVGPIISSATVAAIGTGDGFAKGRDFSAWLGLVPKQISTGDRTILGKIPKRGNKYLRTLFVTPRQPSITCGRHRCCWRRVQRS